MAALSITAQEAALAAAIKAELATILKDGTTGGATIDGSYKDLNSVPDLLTTMYELVAIAAMRALHTQGGVVHPAYTVGTLPAASSHTGKMVYVSNESGGATMAFSNGTNWLRVQDRAIVS